MLNTKRNSLAGPYSISSLKAGNVSPSMDHEKNKTIIIMWVKGKLQYKYNEIYSFI